MENTIDLENTIDFRKYGKSNTDYTFEELIKIYEKITADIIQTETKGIDNER